MTQDTLRVKRPRPAEPPENMAVALGVGTLWGSALVAASVLIVSTAMSLTYGDFGQVIGGGALMALMAFLFSLPVWAGGLIMVGLPGWALLNALGWRSRWAGAAFGGVATFVAVLTLNLVLNLRSAAELWEIAPLAGVLALMGAVVGWVVVTTAYAKKEGGR